LGVDWTDAATLGPGFSTDKNGKGILNRPVWASSNGIEIDTATTGPTNTGANNLIRALTGNGVAAATGGGILTGNGGNTTTVWYLMSNWGDANSQMADTVADGSSKDDDYLATVKFVLEPKVTAAESQALNSKNYVRINIQRAVAKVSVKAMDPSTVLNVAGTGTNAGTFVPIAKWAAGNINCSTYPFQMWSGSTVRSTRYEDTTAILPKVSNKRWAKKMDNTRIETTGSSPQSYEDQNLTASAVITRIGAADGNVEFLPITAPTDISPYYSILTENNNAQTYSHYSTYVLIAGQYQPTQFVLQVANNGAITYYNASTNTPTIANYPTWSSPIINTSTGQTNIDTMYYVSSYGNNGLFFLGDSALLRYIAYSTDMLKGLETDAQTPIVNVSTSPSVQAELAKIKKIENSKYAALQAYWHGNCFYRVFISDNAASDANKVLVRRNHAYNVNITKINGPGIGNPNHIIDPDPSTIDPIEASVTFVTAEINVMKWHVIDQSTELDL
jgi:hypothetical protein